MDGMPRSVWADGTDQGENDRVFVCGWVAICRGSRLGLQFVHGIAGISEHQFALGGVLRFG